ncbi:LysR family transcriptional regulator [Amorphus coralli]|uniref:LysR family transcriptional regulator n=1 Tax=Amorphus coralli TaxID=340680 RepID=UPI000382CD98|nr:LysR family transcriptional regulator [Amorphus coralli]
MNKFLAISVFTRVAENGGFTAAARKLGMSVSAVTKTVARLEDELGTQLFNRTTRQLSTTDYGQEFYERCVRILADLEDAELELQRGNVTPRGRVRAVVPLSFGRVTLVPELPAFFERYPDVALDLSFSDSNMPIDMIRDGLDVAVRTGNVSDSRLVTRLLTRSTQVTVASPDYLKRHGIPQQPSDLGQHNCIIGSRITPEWRFLDRQGEAITVKVHGNSTIESGDALREAAVCGLGIVQGTWWLFRKDLERGALHSILTDYTIDGAPISVLYAANRHIPKKVRVFIDFLVAITKTR